MIQRRRHRNHRGAKSRRVGRAKSYRIVCSGWGKEIVVQVSPPNDKKLLVMECFGIEIRFVRDEFDFSLPMTFF